MYLRSEFYFSDIAVLNRRSPPFGTAERRSNRENMPQNRDAYTRYRMIDVRLRRKPYPHLEDLIDYVSEGLDKPVSKRTLQLDLQEMR